MYVGRVLAPAEGYGRNDNCLVDPGLTVSKDNADFAGHHMDYWPAYETMRLSSRRAYLDWLSDDRSDPGTQIGYAFVCLYKGRRSSPKTSPDALSPPGVIRGGLCFDLSRLSFV